MFKKLLITLMLTGILAVSGCASQPKPDKTADKPVIGVIQLMEHTSLNMIYDSFIEELSQLGYVDGENCTIVFKNAQGEQSNIGSIVSAFQSQPLDVVVAIATPTAQSAAVLADKTPVIFSAVTDPAAAGLLTDPEHPDQNITGTSDEVAVDQILELALTMQPQLKTLGLLYNAGEINSQTNIEKAKAYAEAKGLTVVESVVSNTSEVAQAVQVLSEKCDAVFSPNDNTVATAMPTVTQITRAAGIPMYVGADSMVMDGGTATVGINYEDLGKETARMVDQVLKGTEISQIPVKVFNQNLSVYVNEDALTELKMTLPEAVAGNPQLVMIQDQN